MAWVVSASPGGASVTVGGSASTAVLNNLTNGTTYAVTVHAINGVGIGPNSAPVSVTPGRASSPPLQVQLQVADGALFVSWSVPADIGGSPITSYTVTASPGGATVSSPTTSAVLSGLTNGTAYTVTVSATNGFGLSPPSATAGPLAPGTTPGAPTAVSAVRGNASAAVTWTAPASTGGRPINGYTVTAAPGGATATTTGATSVTVPGLTNGTAYTFTVRASNAIGLGPASAPSTAITPATTPGAPIAATATPGQGTITVAWTAPADTGGLPLLQYRVTTLPGGATTLVAGTSTTLTLSSAVNYTFTIAASNAVGFGPDSAPTTATTTCGCSGVSTCCDGCFPRAIGGSCSDGRFCTVGETCQANGTCGQGTARDCTGAVTVNQCQTPTCDTQQDLCVASPKPNNTACNDTNLCTTVDVCVSGTCTGQSPVTCPETDCRQAGTCTPATGLCVSAPKADGSMCAGPVNTESQCASGACQAVSCVPGFGNCNTATPDCETDLRSDVNSCGLCGQACRTGNRFLNARTRCANAGCVFLGCNPGWRDADGDCTTGAETCNTGCETCQALGDGSFDIPDDGADNDCAGGDSTNTEVLGWYVDSSFTPAGTAACPGGAARGTRGCPFTSLYDVSFAASQQSWMPPGPSRRYVYVAQGNYVDVGTVFETTVPLIYAGGYVRTALGAWTRDGMASIVTSSTGGAVTAARLQPTAGWGAFDGFTFSQKLEVSGNFVLRRVANPSGDTVATGAAAVGIVESSQLRGLDASDIALRNHAFNWKLIDSNIGLGGLPCIQTGWVIQGSQIQGNAAFSPYAGSSNIAILNSNFTGDLGPGPNGFSYQLLLRDVVVSGSLSAGYVTLTPGWQSTLRRVRALNNSYVANATVRECEFNSSQSVQGSFSMVDMEASVVERSHPTSSVSVTQGSVRRSRIRASRILFNVGATYSENVLLGSIQAPSNQCGSTEPRFVLTNNYIQGSPVEAYTLRLMPGSADPSCKRTVISNNVFRSGSASSTAIVEDHAVADPAAVINNAFVGFAPTQIYLDEATSPLADVSRLNTLSQLSACARGGNVAFATDALAGVVSSDLASPLVGRITTGPLIDAARSLPYSCDAWTLGASTTDFTGSNARVCRTAQDIGAYEVCP